MADGDDAFPDLSAGDPQIADSDDSDEFFSEEGFEGYSGEAQSLPPDTPEVLGAGAAAAEAVFAGDIDFSNSPASNATPSSAKPSSDQGSSGNDAPPSSGNDDSDHTMDPNDMFGGGTFGTDDFGDDLDDSGPDPIIETVNDGGGRGAKPKWPTGKSPDPDTIVIDNVEIKLTGDFGELPNSPFLAPIYTGRVLSRKKSLKAELDESLELLELAERDRDDKLKSLVEEYGKYVEGHKTLKPLFTAIAQLEGTIVERSSALEGTAAEHDADNTAMDTAREDLLDEQLGKEKFVEELAAVSEQRWAQFKRVEVRYKRTQIEMRSAKQVADRVAAEHGGVVPKGNQRQMQELQAEATKQKVETDKHKALAAQAEAQTNAARKELSALQSKLRELNSKQKSQDSKFEKQASVRSDGITEIKEQKRAARSDAGRALLATKGAVEIDSDTLDSLRDSDKSVATTMRDHQKLLRAIGCYDDATFKQGASMIAGLVAVLVIVIGLLVSSGGDPSSAQPEQDSNGEHTDDAEKD